MTLLLLLLLGSLTSAAALPEKTGDELHRKAEQGDGAAMFRLADQFYYGANGRRINPELAVYWYRKAAETGIPEAEFNLAVCLERGYGVEKDLHAAFELYEKAAAKGFQAARLNLALHHYNGVPENKNRKIPAKPPLVSFALGELEALAKEEFIPAEVVFAEKCLENRNDPVSVEKAVAVLKRLESRKNPPAAALRMLADCKYAGLGMPKDHRGMIRLLRRAADGGDAEALGKLAHCYEFGRGVPTDAKKAYSLYKISAERGNAMSQFKYAEGLLSGKIKGEPDVRGALFWLREARKRGNPQAMFQLGVMAEEGLGMEKSKEAAARAFFESAKTGYPRAQYNIACMFDKGEGGLPVDASAAFYWFMRAATGGDARAQRAVAIRFFEGKGVQRSISKGEEWLLRAVKGGDEEAVFLLKKRSYRTGR